MSSAESPMVLEVKKEELDLALERARESLSAKDFDLLRHVVEAYSHLLALIAKKRVTISRLKALVFGKKTEKTAELFDDIEDSSSAEGGEEKPTSSEEGSEQDGGADAESPSDEGKRSRKKRRGHGRRKAEEYTGADRQEVAHESLHSGDACPVDDCNGRVYKVKKPAVLVRITATAPLLATLYALERLRCNLCGETFTASLPKGVASTKYDVKSVAMNALLKYGAGFPFHRLERLQEHLGIPLPSSTQWDLVRDAATKLIPLYDEFHVEAAQGEILHNDDTSVKILEYLGKRRDVRIASGEDLGERKGLQTTGIVSVLESGHRIAIFRSGIQHAGENLEAVLEHRRAELPLPIHMADGHSCSSTPKIEAVSANCLSHSRRKYVEVSSEFPAESRFVLEILREVYRVDTEARKDELSSEDRLALHRSRSRPRLAELLCWIRAQRREKRVEPNSSLGESIEYMRKRWRRLTLFVRMPGAPLDNNVVERVLKMAIRNRRNAYFYKTQAGAEVGDIFMSLIHTAELAGVNPFEYLVALLENPLEASLEPAEWLPWRFAERNPKARVKSVPP